MDVPAAVLLSCYCLVKLGKGRFYSTKKNKSIVNWFIIWHNRQCWNLSTHVMHSRPVGLPGYSSFGYPSFAFDIHYPSWLRVILNSMLNIYDRNRVNTVRFANKWRIDGMPVKQMVWLRCFKYFLEVLITVLWTACIVCSLKKSAQLQLAKVVIKIATDLAQLNLNNGSIQKIN